MSAKTNPPPHLEIQLLRTLKISQAGGPNLRVAYSKAKALLYYVAMSGRPHTRSALAARSNLRRTLVNLETLANDYLIREPQLVATRSHGYRVDARALANAVHSPNEGNLPQAITYGRCILEANEFDVGPTAETVDLQKALQQDHISATPPQVEVSSAGNHLTWICNGACAPLQSFRIEQRPKIQNTKNPGTKSWRTLRPVNTQFIHAQYTAITRAT